MNRAAYWRAGITIENCTIDNCGVGVVMDGGHARVDGLEITNTPVAFELNNGATVEGRHITHDVGSAHSGSRRAKRSTVRPDSR